MLLTFSVISFRARRLWQSANAAAEKQPKSIKNDIKIHPISTKMVPRSAPKATLAAGLFQVSKKGAKAFHNFEIFGATWTIWDDISGPAGRQRGDYVREYISEYM